jgi:hypothetical protein
VGVQEYKQSVVGAKLFRPFMLIGIELGKRCFLEFEMGMKIGLSCPVPCVDAPNGGFDGPKTVLYCLRIKSLEHAHCGTCQSISLETGMVIA